jgi:DNA-directed RNA polymerase subunit RPC12/RpoP
MRKSEIREIGNRVSVKSRKLLSLAVIFSVLVIVSSIIVFKLELLSESANNNLMVFVIIGLALPPILVSRQLAKLSNTLDIVCTNCMSKVDKNALDEINENSICPKCGKEIFSDEVT